MSRKTLQLTPEQQAKVDNLKRSHEDNAIDDEWRIIAEFGTYYGYEGIKAIRNNEISIEEVRLLLTAAHKSWNKRVIDIANAVYVATAASQSKKGSMVMKKGLKEYRRNS